MNSFFAVCLIFAANVLVTSSSQEFCLTEACNRTSNYIGLDGLISSTINPCDDFEEFLRQGWRSTRPKPIMSEVINTVYERTVKLLAENSADDAKITKVAKKMFQKCIDPDKKVLESWNDMADYLKSLGSSPFIDGPSWQPSSFSFDKIFKAEPKIALKVFFNREVQPCSGLSTSSLCLRDTGFDFLAVTDYAQFLSEVFENESLQRTEVFPRINETATGLREFDKDRNRFIPFFVKPTTDVKLGELKEFLDIDWVDFLNAVRLDGTDELSPDDSVGIEYFEFGKELLKFVSRSDKRLLADRFVVQYISEYRSVFGKSFIRNMLSGLVPDSPKFCIIKEISLFFPVLSSLYNNEFFKQEVTTEILKTTKEAITTLHDEEAVSSKIPQHENLYLKMNLAALKIRDGFTEAGWRHQSTVDKIYKNFDLTGDESEYMEARKLGLKHNKITAEPTVSFDYDSRAIAFNIPSFFISHPAWFDANNPKFYTAATFTVSILELLTRNQPNKAVTVAFNSYKKWLLDGNRELNLRKGNLTNEQLFWITLGMDAISREEEQLEAAGKSTISNEFLHIQFKKNTGFQEAFNCSLTEAEANKLKTCRGNCDETTKMHELAEDFIFFILKDGMKRNRRD